MRQAVFAAAAVLFVIIVAIFSAAIITARGPKQAQAATARGSIDVMQMMKDAKDLADQQFDAI
jgi:hypothetical protein